MKLMRTSTLALGFFFLVQVAQADWTSVKRITWTSGESSWPAIAVDSSDNLHVVWYDDTPGEEDIYYKRSTDGGDTWTASQRLTWNKPDSVSPAIAVDSLDYLHVVWSEGPSGECEIHYKRSKDGGATWMATQRLSWNMGNSQSPSIAVDSSDNLHVVWFDGTPGNCEIYYRKGN